MLTSVTTVGDTPVGFYEYDYLGRRIMKTRVATQTTTVYCYDGENVIAHFAQGVALVRKYIYGPGIDEPICVIVTGMEGAADMMYYYHYDGLGSVIALSNEYNQIEEQYSYDAFGRHNGYSSNNPYSFTGREYDEETGKLLLPCQILFVANRQIFATRPHWLCR